jgi:hypothetical protein
VAPGQWYYWSGKDLLIHVHIQTRAKRDEIGNIHNGRVKIRITAPPVAGKANKYLCAYLAGEFKQAQSAVEIIKGALTRDKLVRIRRPQTSPDWFREFIQTDKFSSR